MATSISLPKYDPENEELGRFVNTDLPIPNVDADTLSGKHATDLVPTNTVETQIISNLPSKPNYLPSPVFLSPAVNGGPVDSLVINTFTTTFPFYVSSPNSGAGLHNFTDWEIATDSSFNNIVDSSIDDGANLVEFALTLANTGTYYARVRFNISGLKSEWTTTAFLFDVTPGKITTPGINYAGDLNTVDLIPVFSLTNYVNTAVDTHKETELVLYKLITEPDGTFKQTSVYTFTEFNTKTKIGLSQLDPNSNYKLIVRYTATNSLRHSKYGVLYFRTRSHLNLWTETNELPSFITNHSITKLTLSNRIVVLGRGVSSTDTTYLYMASKDGHGWTRLVNPLPLKLIGCGISAYTEGGVEKVLVTGGLTDKVGLTGFTKNVYSGHIINDVVVWTPKLSLTVPNGIAFHGQITASDGNIYVMLGGETAIAGGSSYIKGVDTLRRYNIATNTWTTLASTGFGQWNGTVVERTPGTLSYIGGRFNDPSSPGVSSDLFSGFIYNYDIASNTWTNSLISGGDKFYNHMFFMMKDKRFVYMNNPNVLVNGGLNKRPKIKVYDIDRSTYGSIELKSPIDYELNNGARSIELENGNVLVVGGMLRHGSPSLTKKCFIITF